MIGKLFDCDVAGNITPHTVAFILVLLWVLPFGQPYKNSFSLRLLVSGLLSGFYGVFWIYSDMYHLWKWVTALVCIASPLFLLSGLFLALIMEKATLRYFILGTYLVLVLWLGYILSGGGTFVMS